MVVVVVVQQDEVVVGCRGGSKVEQGLGFRAKIKKDHFETNKLCMQQAAHATGRPGAMTGEISVCLFTLLTSTCRYTTLAFDPIL